MSSFLQNNAVLVNLSISAWTARKTDSEATQLVLDHYKADSDSGNFTLQIIPKQAFCNITASAMDSRKTHLTLSSPWANNGRIINIAGLDKWREKMRGHKSVFEFSVIEFCDQYESHWLPMARQKRGNLFRESDCPSVESVKRKFGFHTSVSPVPNVNDWRVNVSRDQMEIMRQNLTAEIDAAMESTRRDVYARTIEVLQAFVDKVGAYVPGSKGDRAQSAFKQATVRHIQELADILPALNVTGDSRIDELQKTLADLARHDADDLKTDKQLRSEKVKRASDILAKAQAFM